MLGHKIDLYKYCKYDIIDNEIIISIILHDYVIAQLRRYGRITILCMLLNFPLGILHLNILMLCNILYMLIIIRKSDNFQREAMQCVTLNNNEWENVISNPNRKLTDIDTLRILLNFEFDNLDRNGKK